MGFPFPEGDRRLDLRPVSCAGNVSSHPRQRWTIEVHRRSEVEDEVRPASSSLPPEKMVAASPVVSSGSARTPRTTMTTPNPPSPTTNGQAWLGRVQALLAKAERTEFPQEAEALLAKAQDLMSRHAISEAMVEAGRGSATASESVTTLKITIDAPYASAKRTLLGAVSAANSCRTVYLGGAAGTQICHVFGHRGELANVETLFASLSVQAVRAMVAAPVPPGDTPRRFRHAFLLSYATRVGQRLREAGEKARAEAAAVGGSGVALMLADRDDAVDEALREAYPRTRTARLSASSGAGWRSGRSAADRAGLGQRGLGSSSRALGAG